MPKDDPVGLPELELPPDLLLLLLLLLLEEPELLLLLLPKAFMMLLLLSQDMVTEIIFVWMWDSVSLVFSRRDPDLNSCSEPGIQDIYTCGFAERNASDYSAFIAWSSFRHLLHDLAPVNATRIFSFT